MSMSAKSWLLKERQKLPLAIKETMTKNRIIEWYKYFKGEVYVSFSGGKDSTVLLHQVRKIFKEVPAVFIDTGLEYPEIRDFVKTIDNVVWLKPKMTFNKVIEQYGFPVVGKRQAKFISDIQRSSDKNKNTVNLRLTGYNRKGIFCPTMKLAKKWLPLAYSNIVVSDRCCHVLKQEPLNRYKKENKKFPITGVMAFESRMREKQYLEQGCNSFKSKTNPISMPIAFWTDKDIWRYINKYKILYSKIYDMGEKRTGCMFCMFGVHLEKSPNRFQRMKITHPKQYNYCINKLGCGEVLDFINVNY
jgi:3'-phosphoadenosine 5'-phosphosulfate sulfotransferase (PAPS reductase)/FAD synthetase